MKLPVQKVKSEHIRNVYSINPKVNSIIRTLIALNGTQKLWPAVSDFVYTTEGQEMTFEEIQQLYQTTKYVMWVGRDNE